jgi:SAM-dependent methyltransferase
MRWLYIFLVFLVVIICILVIFSRRVDFLAEDVESFDNPLEIKKDMMDKNYVAIYDKVFNEKEMYVVEAKVILDFLKKKRVNGYILDAGTGTGKHYLNLSTGGAKILGIERSDAMVNVFKKRNPLGRVEKGDLRNENLFGAQKFSVICCLKETLYHNKVKDWDTILSNFYYWLKPGGYLIIHLFDREKLDPAPRNFTFLRTDGSGRKHGITNFTNFTHDGWWQKKGDVICQFNEIIALRDKKGKVIDKKHYKHNLAIPKRDKIMEKILNNYFKMVDIVKMEKIGIIDHDLCFFKKIK